MDTRLSEKINYVLLEIANAINTTHDLKDLFPFVHNTLEKLIPLPNFFIALYDERRRILNFEYFKDELDKDVEISQEIDLPNSLTSEVLIGGRPIFLKEYALAERARKNKIIGPVPKIWIGSPLMVQDRSQGVICIQHYTNPDHFSHIHLELLVGVASLVAVALERRHLFKALEQERAILRFIKSHSQSLVAFLDSKGLYKSVNTAHDQLGYTPFDLVGTSLFDILHPEDTEQLKTSFTTEINIPASDIQQSFRFKDKTGAFRQLKGRFKFIQDASETSGNIVFVGDGPEKKDPVNRAQSAHSYAEKNVKTILIVEDEEMVRSAFVKATSSFGYKVLEASDGETALSIYQAQSKNIDVTLLDVILPRISGAEIFKKMMEINPRAKIIITSGHITSQDREEIFANALAYMEKPFQMIELKNMLEDALAD